MKVILKTDIKNLGKKGEVIEVKNGYARNFLLKKGLATLATKSALLELEEKRKQQKIKIEKETKKTEILAQKLKKETLVFKLKTNPKGLAFGSITKTKILKELLKKGYPLKKSQIILEKPLKEFKSHQIPIKLDYQISSQIEIIIKKA